MTQRETQSFLLPWQGIEREGNSEVCAFCSFQRAYWKTAREVALLCVFGFLKLLI